MMREAPLPILVRTTTKMIGNVPQGKVPGRGSGGKTSEFVSRWSIDSVDINSLLR